VSAGPLASSRLRRLAQRQQAGAARAPAAAQPGLERCDLCAAPLPPEHRHLLDLDTGQPECACRACVILFDRGQAGGDHYRLIPERRLRLDGPGLDDRLWAALGIPVDLAFVTVRGATGAAVARYPSPIGLTSAAPAPDAWEQVVAADPRLAEMEPDVEALLVNRARGARERWLVPIDDCFRLAARLRAHWSGFGGGDAVWEDIARFFAELHERYDPKEEA
jgi:Family of unknown function (DUF5947)